MALDELILAGAVLAVVLCFSDMCKSSTTPVPQRNAADVAARHGTSSKLRVLQHLPRHQHHAFRHSRAAFVPDRQPW